MRLHFYILAVSLVSVVACGQPPAPPAHAKTAAPKAVVAMSPKQASLQIVKTVVVVPLASPVLYFTNTLTGTFPITNLNDAFFQAAPSMSGPWLNIADFTISPVSNLWTITMTFVSTNQNGYFRAGDR